MIFGPTVRKALYTAITSNPEYNFPCSTEIHWRLQNNKIELWMSCLNAASMTIGISMDQEIWSDSWTGFTQFTLLEEKHPDGYMWSGGRLTKRQVTSRPDYLWPWTHGRNWEEMQSWRRSRNGPMKKTKLDNARHITKKLFHWTLRTRNSKKPKRMLARNWKHQWSRYALQNLQEE